MNCQTLIGYLSDYIDNQLSDDLAAEAREHLMTCRNCHVVLNSTQKTILLYRQRGEKAGLSERRHQALFSQLADALVKRPSIHEESCDDDSASSGSGFGG